MGDEAIRNAIIDSLRRSAVHATEGIMLAQKTGQTLSQIPRDFHLRGMLDARDVVACDAMTRRPNLISHFL